VIAFEKVFVIPLTPPSSSERIWRRSIDLKNFRPLSTFRGEVNRKTFSGRPGVGRALESFGKSQLRKCRVRIDSRPTSRGDLTLTFEKQVINRMDEADTAWRRTRLSGTPVYLRKAGVVVIIKEEGLQNGPAIKPSTWFHPDLETLAVLAAAHLSAVGKGPAHRYLLPLQARAGIESLV
jgi:hypothetical protein